MMSPKLSELAFLGQEEEGEEEVHHTLNVAEQCISNLI